MKALLLVLSSVFVLVAVAYAVFLDNNARAQVYATIAVALAVLAHGFADSAEAMPRPLEPFDRSDPPVADPYREGR